MSNEHRQRRSVMWVQQSASGMWSCLYCPPLTDAPVLLAEGFTADQAVDAGVDRYIRLRGTMGNNNE